MRPYLYFVAVVLLWASTPTVVKRLYREQISTLVMLTAASLFAAIVLMLASAATHRLSQVRQYSVREWAVIVAMGLLGIVGYTSLYYTAFNYGPAGEVNTINYLWPVLLVLFSRPILGERHDLWTWVGVAMSFVGAAGLATGWRWQTPAPSHLVAYLCALAGAVCWALFSVLGKRLKYDRLVTMALYCAVGATVFGLVLMVAGGGKWPSTGAWVRLVFLGAAVNGAAYVLWFEALAAGPTALFGNLIFATPFMSLLYLWVFGYEHLQGRVWLSLGLIVAGSLISVNRALANQRASEKHLAGGGAVSG